MTSAEFMAQCDGAGFNYAAGAHDGVPGYFVHWEACPVKDEVVHCAMTTIEEQDWAAILRFVHKGRNVHAISRICGYYSRISNWNPSKLGELRDRHAGNYALSEAQ